MESFCLNDLQWALRDWAEERHAYLNASDLMAEMDRLKSYLKGERETL